MRSLIRAVLGNVSVKKIKKDTDGNWLALSQVKHAS
ncbi:hypothetical protein BUN12_1972 [Bacillus amyloliquefaciens]|nr:hypothetical protein S101267_03000 [Bacillus amyloliquefaciens]AZV90228.1 hypothetical protein BUN12_1972 [Bacillus amyloliquefaciens]